MSRRDTIIIAVLVNAALLVVLFVTGVRSGKEETVIGSTDSKFELADSGAKPQSGEEFLNQYITSVPTMAEQALSQNTDPLHGMPYEEISISLPLTEPIPASEEMALVNPPPSAPLPIETTSTNTTITVTVKKGDFLEKIAKANGTTVSAIVKANNLSSTQLKIGQVLKIPTKGSKPTEEVARNSLPPSSNPEYYTVREGDNPWLIASRNHLKVEELLKLNQLDEQKAKKLRPGDKLRIR